jgi:hypothetical protein
VPRLLLPATAPLSVRLDRLPAGWTPSSISSATLRGFVDFENNSKITTASGAVSAISCSVSNASFSQGTTGSRPALVTSEETGRQVARFDGSADNLSYTGIPSNWPTGSTAGGMFVVGTQTAFGGSVRYAAAYGGAATSTNRSILNTAPTWGRLNADGSTATSNFSQFRGPVTALLNVGSSVLSGFINDVPVPSSAVTLNTGTTRARIGASTATSAGNFWQGDLSAVVVWSGTLSALDTHLLQLWGWQRLGFDGSPPWR